MNILKAFAFLTKSFTKLDTSSLTNSVSQKSMANTLLLMEESPGRTSQAVQFRTPHFHCRGPRVNPWLGTKIQNAAAWPKKKKSILAKSRNQLPCPDCHGVLEFQPS